MKCPTCETSLSSHRRCAPCLLRAALEDDDSIRSAGHEAELPPDPEPPFHVDGYHVLEKIDTGGMGVVYLARNEHSQRCVALKMMRNVFANEDALRLFRREIEATALAESSNIVRVRHVGEYGGRLYYTMELCDSSLAGSMQDFARPGAAARLIEVVARAVHDAHKRGVLHLDLKPANILFKDRQPHIADFGLARLLVGPAETAEPLVPGASLADPRPRSGWSSVGTLGVGGTPPYMAPEQMTGAATTACDIYSLGVILLELLAGSQHLSAPSSDVAVSVLKRCADRDLTAICLKCVCEDSDARYGTALELAEDLKRWRAREPASVGPRFSWRRVRSLAIRQRWVAAALAIVALLGAAFGVSIHNLQSRTIAAVLVANSFAAEHLSGNVLRELDDYAAALQRLGEDPALVALVQGPPQRHAPILERYLQGIFDTIGVYRLDGTRNARWPSVAPGRIVSLDFGWRDYFIGADRAGRMGLRTAYVARCILSEGDGRNKIVLSAPLFDRDRYVGVLMATIDTAATLGALSMDELDPEGPRGTLIGLKDRSRRGTHSRDYMVVVHEGLADGQAADIDHDLALRLVSVWGDPAGAGEQLRRIAGAAIRDARYRDPVPGFEDRWLAGMAPVGRTGLGVVVRTRYRDAVRPSDEMIAYMAWWMLGLAGGSIAFVVGIRAARKLARAPAAEATPTTP